MPPFEKQSNVPHRRAVRLVRRQTHHAWPEAAVDVVLQARMRVPPRKIDLAGRHFKVPVNEVH